MTTLGICIGIAVIYAHFANITIFLAFMHVSLVVWFLFIIATFINLLRGAPKCSKCHQKARWHRWNLGWYFYCGCK